MKCLVSGATGFIGRELCKQFSAGGVPFVALSCNGAALPDGRTTVPLDLATEGVAVALLAGVDVVFHLAGIAHQNAESAAYERVNFQATMDLAAAAARAGVKSFIFVSSVKAMGVSAGGEPRTEDCCTMPQDAYGLSKRRAELELQATYADADMSVVILRPALVYGAGAMGNLQLMARAVRRGVPRPPERGGRSMVSLEDLVALLLRLVLETPAGVHTWIVSDGHTYSAGQIHDLMRTALGKKPSRSWLPIGAWRLGCGLRDFLSSSEQGSTFEKVFGAELYSSAALQLALDWRPKVALADAIEDVVAPPGRGEEARW